MSKLTRNVVWFLEPERPNCKIVRGVASLWNIELTRQLLTYFSVPGNLVISFVFRVLQKSVANMSLMCEEFMQMILVPPPGGISHPFWMTLLSFVYEKLVLSSCATQRHLQRCTCATAKARIGVCNYVSRSSQSPSYSFPHAAAALSVGQSVGTNH